MPTRHFGSLPKNSSIRLRVNFLRSTTFPVASTPWTWKTDLAISSPIVVTCFMLLSLRHTRKLSCRRGGEPSTSSKAATRTGRPLCYCAWRVRGMMAEKRKIAAILAADVVGFSRMASADEDRTLARLRALRADVIDPIIAGQNGRVFKRTGDGALVEFRSVVEAVRCAISVQNAMA